MEYYSEERKQAILRKLAPPNNMTVPEVVAQEGIGRSTLYHWRKVAREAGAIMPSNSATPENWSSEEKFRAVVKTASMSQAERSEYCRRYGLYPETLDAWRAACIGGNDVTERQTKQSKLTHKMDKKRIKKLETELRRKNDALAETAALLALSKKLEAFWNQDEDE